MALMGDPPPAGTGKEGRKDDEEASRRFAELLSPSHNQRDRGGIQQPDAID